MCKFIQNAHEYTNEKFFFAKNPKTYLRMPEMLIHKGFENGVRYYSRVNINHETTVLPQKPFCSIFDAKTEYEDLFFNISILKIW